MEKQKLPNSTVILVLGILSIVTCFCWGIIGLICGIIAVILAFKEEKLYKSEPDRYTGIGNVTAGKITGIIGIVLSLIYIAYIIWIISYIGFEAMQDPELMQQKVQELLQ